MKNTNKLWVQNLSTMDVSVSDLGVKVLAGKTANVYAANPYLTKDQVGKSLKVGALRRRIESKVLKVVKSAPKTFPAKLLKEADKGSGFEVGRVKSSVVVKQNEMDAQEESGKFDFADYGISDLGPDVAAKRSGESVFVHAAQDINGGDKSGTELSPQLEGKTNSQVVMKEPGADNNNELSLNSETITLVNPPKEKTEEPNKTEKLLSVSKGPSGEILVSGTDSKARSLKNVKNGEESDAKISMEETPFDSKVATQTKDGAIVMKLKEDVDQQED